VTGVVRTSAWDLAVESLEEALADGVVPSLERLGRLGQLGTLPSFVASLDGDEDPGELAEDHARERESLGLAPAEVAAELLVLGRILDRHGESEARHALDRCVVAYVERVTGELAERARRDPLTGVLNHRAFHARLLAEAARARRYRSRIALLLFDLDRFKETNDREGHQEGDRLLRAFASALAGTARETDSVGRLGGDEFAAILPRTTPVQARMVAQRMHTALATPIVVADHTFRVQASVGISAAGRPGMSTATLLHEADTAMYRAKKSRADTAVAIRDWPQAHHPHRDDLARRRA